MTTKSNDLKRTVNKLRMENIRRLVDKFQTDAGVSVPYTDDDVLSWIHKGMDRMGMTEETMTPSMESQVTIASLICSGMCSTEFTDKYNAMVEKIPLMPC